MAKTKILLLTNRDSDNLGDQIIEASVISIIEGIMLNLGVAKDGYEINSRAAGIISKRYMNTRDESLLELARELISGSDIVVFGGAPLFNYTYQPFYLRTIRAIELANEYGVPVIFSSIGVEPFDPTNPKCLQLKEALALPCVRQITTRDDFEALKGYVEGTDVPIAHVADPAVFADIVFRPAPPEYLTSRSPLALARRGLRRLPVSVDAKNQAKNALKKLLGKPVTVTPSANAAKPGKQRIGLLVTRRGIFKDNGIDFTEYQQRQFWLDTIALLTARGYDVRLFTTGHFSDEVFLSNLVRDAHVPEGMTATVINSPEGLIGELNKCAGVIAFRLHASITSFALDIPSVGLSWNFKVPYFYDSVGHGDRALGPDQWRADVVVDALEKAMSEGVRKDEAFLTSVYDTLFSAFKGIVAPASAREPFTLEELKTKLPAFPGTTPAQYAERARNKIRRIYKGFPEMPKHPSPEEEYLRFCEERPVDTGVVLYAAKGSTMRGGIDDERFAEFERLSAHPDYRDLTHVLPVATFAAIPKKYKGLEKAVFVRKDGISYREYLAVAGHVVSRGGVPSYFTPRAEQHIIDELPGEATGEALGGAASE